MMDVKNLNIWKTEKKQNPSCDIFLNTDIAELNLSVRSFNCLKRANCHTVGDILNCLGENGQGLRKIRNLGSRSETEIMEKINEYREYCAENVPTTEKKKVTIIRPAKKIWDRGVDEFHISNAALTNLKECGVNTIGDLYASSIKREPGWYAVRELFAQIPNSR